jgi:hypothetical protein
MKKLKQWKKIANSESLMPWMTPSEGERKGAERGSQVYRKEKEGNQETSQKAYFHRRAN